MDRAIRALKSSIVNVKLKLVEFHFLFLPFQWLRKESVPGKTLNLAKDDTLQKQVDGCREKYVFLGFMVQTFFNCLTTL